MPYEKERATWIDPDGWAPLAGPPAGDDAGLGPWILPASSAASLAGAPAWHLGLAAIVGAAVGYLVARARQRAEQDRAAGARRT